MDFLTLHCELNLLTGPRQRCAVACLFQMDYECVHPVDKLILKREQVTEVGMLDLSSKRSNQVTHSSSRGSK